MTDMAARIGAWLLRTSHRVGDRLRTFVSHNRPSRARFSPVRALATDLCLISAVCSLLWGGIGLLLHQQREDVLRDALHDTENLARVFEENTTRTVDAIDRTLLFLRSTYAANAGHLDLATWDRDVQALDDLTLQLAVIDAAGQLRASNLGPVRRPVDLSDREHFRAQATSGRDALFISKPVLGRESGKWSIQFTRRVVAADGSFAGVAVVSVDPFSLARFYASLDIGRGGNVLLVGLDGIVRAGAPVSTVTLGRDISDSALLAAARAGRKGTLRVPGSGGTMQLMSFRRLDRYGLIVAVGLDRDEVLAGYNRAWAEYLAGGAALTGLILLVGGSVVRRRQALLRSQQVLTDTLEHMSQGIFMVDSERRVAVINRRAIELLGLPPSLVTAGTSFDDILRWQLNHGEFDDNEDVRRLAESGGLEITNAVYERTRPDGTVLEVRSHRLSKDRAVRTFTDVTERKRAEARISYLAHHDGLTGLANRTLFQDRLAHAISLSHRGRTSFAVLCLDLDRFKQVNDARGHDVGDLLLQAVADRLRASVRDSDTVARFGGDEFAILQTDVGQPTAAAALAERLVADLAKPYEIGGAQLVIGTSIGVALHPADGLTADHLLKSADIALYQAKEDGRGTFRFFEPEMDQRLQERYALERDLREAVAEGRLDIHFQPICDAHSGRPLAYEALVRWTHPVRGSIPPSVFIPLAEEIGLIPDLGRFVLRAACAEAAKWPRHVHLTVNLSPLQFLDPGLDEQILSILHDAGLEPGRLCLEVTEGALIRNGDEALAIIRALRRRGVRVYLDDFGTGHAGLTYLLRFPFDCIKIDRSFVGRLATDRAAQAIVRAAMLLGENLQLDVVAEGVETAAQLDLLRGLGCRRVQGFLLDRPRPAREIAEDRFRSGYLDSLDAPGPSVHG